MHEAEIVRPRLLALVLGEWSPQMDDEIDVLARRVVYETFAEGTFPDCFGFGLRDCEAVGLRAHQLKQPTGLVAVIASAGIFTYLAT